MQLHQTIFSIKELKNKVKTGFPDGIPNLKEKIELIETWQENIYSGKVEIAKEEEIKPMFLTTFFGDILGYEYKNSTKWNLRLENKTDFDSTKADAALGYFDFDKTLQGFENLVRSDVRVVIEIKNARTTLDLKTNKPSAVEQAFMYAAKSGGKCKWVIVSNFLEIRFYLASDMNKYESFDILKLNEVEEFSRFYYLLAKEQLFYQKIDSKIDILLAERIEKEKNITNEFYEKYQYLREAFLQHLKLHNPKHNSLDLLQYTQTLIDRIIFVSVIKDYNLIDYDILKRLERNADEALVNDNLELWRQLKTLFSALDKGLPPRIQKFNGGLFKQNDEIDNLKITNLFLKRLLELNKYDFESDLKINVLGHIFEQSITDLEILKKEILENKKVEYSETETDIIYKSQIIESGKRKKDGIFYTPENITQYIVNNTIGTWLVEQKEILGLNKIIEFPKNETERKNLIDLWEKYTNILKTIKILDPACGSGAFLTQSFDFLLQEWIVVIDILEKLNKKQSNKKSDKLANTFLLQRAEKIAKIKKEIVTNNLFGVDLNYESVEITKLGLWLNSANKHDELAVLDNNIKTGNSLISDKTVSEHAFVWENEFSEIMQNGGFDIVVGNPPYVVIKGGRFLEGYQYSDSQIKYIRTNYQTAEQQINTYILFVEKCLNLTKDSAALSFIIPNTFLANEYSKKFRNYLLNKTNIIEIYNTGIVFDKANVETLILSLSKKIENLKKTKLKIAENETFIDLQSISKITTDKKFILNLTDEILPLIEKIKKYPLLIDFAKVSMGISTGDNKKYLVKIPNNEKHKKVISGSEVQRYFLKKNIYYVYYEPEKLDRAREEGIFLTKEKLISKFVGTKLTFCYDNQQHYVLNTACSVVIKNEILQLKYVLALLNSKILDWYFHIIFSDYRETFPIMKSGNLESLPIPVIPIDKQQIIIDLVDNILELNIKIEKSKTKFINRIISNYKLKHTNFINDFYNLQFSDFNNEFIKNKINLSLKQQDELEEYFNENKDNLNLEIEKVKSFEKQIDNLVYEIYGLTKEEIEIIEK